MGGMPGRTDQLLTRIPGAIKSARRSCGATVNNLHWTGSSHDIREQTPVDKIRRNVNTAALAGRCDQCKLKTAIGQSLRRTELMGRQTDPYDGTSGIGPHQKNGAVQLPLLTCD